MVHSSWLRVFLFVLVWLLPSYKILQQELITPPWTLPDYFIAGAPLFLDIDKNVTSLRLQGRSMSILNNSRKAFGLVGIYGHDSVVVTGTMGEITKNNFFRSAQKNYFLIYRPLIKKDLGKAPQLRIPTHIQQRLEEPSLAQRERERQISFETLIHHSSPLELSQCWKRPVDNIVTSAFGRPRIPPNGNAYYHTGTDLRARTGTPVYSPIEATVVYTGHMTVPGNMIVLDHGGGLYTRYMHLSQINVELGQRVAQGELLGRAGSTGRVEAPHLHWEILWKELHGDPLLFLAALCKLAD